MNDILPFLCMMRAHRGWMILGAVLSLTTLLASIALLTLAGWFITASALVGMGGFAALTGFNYHYASGGIRAFALSRVVSRYFERITTHEATFRLLAHLRHWFFVKALRLSPGQLGTKRSGDMLTRITADIDALDNLYLRVLVPTLVAAIAVLTILVFMGLYSPPIALATLAGLGVAGIVLPRWANRKGEAPGKALTEQSAHLRTELVDAIDGAPELLSYGAAHRQQAQIGDTTHRLLATRKEMTRITALSNAGTVLVSQGTLMLVLIIGAMALSSGTMAGPVLALLGFCAMASFEAVMPLSLAWQYWGRTQSAARRLNEIAETKPLVEDPASPAAITGELTLELDCVEFTYPGAKAPALSGISLTLKPGDKIALRGTSGGGKSTLLSLILRLYDPAQGTIRLGGTDLKDLAQGDLWEQIGFLSQRTDLFSASIRGNLLIAKPDASDAQLREAVRAAGLERFIAAQPMGLDTWVGENGALVSGGEARRIALARVILKNAPILLLDEPTEGLDAATERDVLHALGEFAADKTVLMVTHRDAPLAGLDKTWIMEDGRLRE